MHSNPAKHDHISAKKNRGKLIKLCCDDCLLDFYEPIVDRKQKIDQFWLHSKQSKRFGTVLPSFMLRRMTLLHFLDIVDHFVLLSANSAYVQYVIVCFPAYYVNVLLIMGIFGINYRHILHISSTIGHVFCILCQNLLILYSSAWNIMFSGKCRVRMPSPGLQD